jgi:hypothetical protein
VWESTHVIVTSELVAGEWSATRPGLFTLGGRSIGTHWIGGWVDPRDCLDDMEKRKLLPLPGLEHRSLCRPAGSQSLYRLLCWQTNATLYEELLPFSLECSWMALLIYEVMDRFEQWREFKDVFDDPSGLCWPLKPRDEQNTTNSYVQIFIVAPYQLLVPLTRHKRAVAANWVGT